jgi:hypothetical protein
MYALGMEGGKQVCILSACRHCKTLRLAMKQSIRMTCWRKEVSWITATWYVLLRLVLRKKGIFCQKDSPAALITARKQNWTFQPAQRDKKYKVIRVSVKHNSII